MSTDLTAADAKPRLRSLQYVVGSMAAADALVGVVGLLIQPITAFDATTLLICIAIGAVGSLVALGLQPTLVPPVPKESVTPANDGFTRLYSLTMVQASLCTGSGLVLFALSFAFELSPLPVLVGMLVACAGTLAVTWPGAGRLRRVTIQLERAGARVRLDELGR